MQKKRVRLKLIQSTSRRNLFGLSLVETRQLIWIAVKILSALLNSSTKYLNSTLQNSVYVLGSLYALIPALKTRLCHFKYEAHLVETSR